MHGKRSGSVPRKTIINDQPHMLAYINPEEAMMLKSMGGAGKPGPGGIPAFYYGGDFGEAGRGGGESRGRRHSFSSLKKKGGGEGERAHEAEVSRVRRQTKAAMSEGQPRRHSIRSGNNRR